MAIQKYKGHLALLGAAIMWGLMSPIGKTALENGISGLSLATFRMTGGAICFWIASIFAPKEQVKPHDLMMLFFAGLLGIVLNQGCFTFGLSLTSPIDASIVTTTAPIATMIVAAIYLKEPVTGKKVIGIFLGSIGALTLILSSQGSTDGKGGSIPGDLLCLLAQISFSFYLAIFKGLISRYNIFTLMKWMFTYAAICFIPFSYHEVSTIHFHEISTSTWGLRSLRHCRWNIPCLYSDDDRTENIAPYCHQYVQLCAAYRRNQCLYLVRNGNLRHCQRNSCGTGIHGSLYCDSK